MRRRECEGEAANGLRRQPARGLARDMGGMVVENGLDRGVGRCSLYAVLNRSILRWIDNPRDHRWVRRAAIAARCRFSDGAQRAGTSFWKRLIVIVLLRKPAYENITRTPLPRRYGWLAAPVDCGSGFGLGGGHWGSLNA